MGSHGTQPLVASIDGGGTKTVCIIATVQGEVLGVGRGGPLNAIFVPKDVAADSVRRAARSALEQATQAGHVCGPAPVSVGALYASAPGAGEDIIRSGIVGLLDVEKLRVEGDDLATFVGALAGAGSFGVVALAGTGSFALGMNADGRRASVGGWGPLLGDEGSAYAIGLESLRTVVRACDGRQEAAVLRQMVLAEFGIEDGNERQLVHAVDSREKVASVAKIASAAAALGDGAAQGILRMAGLDLAGLVVSVLRRLDMMGQGAPVALAGGAARAGSWLTDAFEAEIHEADSTCVVVEPRFSPAGGATILALEMACGKPVPGESVEMLTREAVRVGGI